YEDYDGNTRTQDFWFNLSQREIARMEVSTPGGFEAMVKRIIDAKSQVQLIDLFENLIHMSYGVKSADGVHFIKNEEVWQEFASTNAYNDLYMELITDTAKASEFFNGIMQKPAKKEPLSVAPAAQQYKNAKEGCVGGRLDGKSVVEGRGLD